MKPVPENLDEFQSTLPGWGATIAPWMLFSFRCDFNPRSPDGERRCGGATRYAEHVISIHAPRMGSDPIEQPTIHKGAYFNPRSPDGERPSYARGLFHAPRHFNPRSPDGERHDDKNVHRPYQVFQSTLPGWGATTLIMATRRRTSDFNPRSPDGERRARRCLCRAKGKISIHAPRMGSDYRDRYRYICQPISIHAPRMGSD